MPTTSPAETVVGSQGSSVSSVIIGSPYCSGVAAASTYNHRGVITPTPNAKALGLMRCTLINQDSRLKILRFAAGKRDPFCHSYRTLSPTVLWFGLSVLELLAAGGFELSLRPPATARQDVGDHVVAQWRVLTLRIELDPLPRQTDRLI